VTPREARWCCPPASAAWAARSRSRSRSNGWRRPRAVTCDGRARASQRRPAPTATCDRHRPSRPRRGARAGRRTAKQPRASAAVGRPGRQLPPTSIPAVLVARGAIPDIVTDQTSAHDLLCGVRAASTDRTTPSSGSAPRTNELARVSTAAPSRTRPPPFTCEAMLALQRTRAAIVFDYGNNLRAQAQRAGVAVRGEDGAYKYPGFVPAYIRPLVLSRGPRAVPLGRAVGRANEDIARARRTALHQGVCSPTDEALERAGCASAQASVHFRSSACPRASAGSATASATSFGLRVQRAWYAAGEVSAARSSSAATTSTAGSVCLAEPRDRGA
jgi:hypothetical protein